MGGNASAVAFFNQHGCTSSAANAKYNSRAAQLYREKIKTLATQATRRHGTELWLDSQAPLSPTSPDEKNLDFFSLHTQTLPENLNMAKMSLSSSITEKPNTTEEDKNGNPEEGPSTEILSISPTANKEVSLLLKKKPAAAKKSLAAKKGGLGAQKVSSKSFSEVEKMAQAADKLREKEESTAAGMKTTFKADDSIAPSLRLAYKDLEHQRKLEDKKLSQLEGKKKEQAERLGMGLGIRSGITHSVTSDMQIIQQENPLGAKTKKSQKFVADDDNEANFSSRGLSQFEEVSDTSDIFSSRWDDSSEGRGWLKESNKPEPDFFITAPLSARDERSTSRRKTETVPVVETGDALKKFGDAKAISSDMYFGKQDNSEYEARTRLERFSANSAISSSDLFDDQKKQSSSSYRLTNVLPSAPDMSGLKQGVRSVAGKLSVMASGVVNTIQDHYGS